MTKESVDQLVLPCLRATMGDWVYYTALMDFGKVAERIRTAEEIHSHKGLRDQLQRALSKRADSISEYLKSQPQHFFNAIIVGIYDGEPRWYDIEVSSNAVLDLANVDESVTGSIGVLVLSGKEKIFAIDGQHRLEGIKKAIIDLDDLAQDEQAVIFLAHRNTAQGMERTRRLFSTLNRYAKPVSLPDIIALDEDDVIAIITRQLLESNEYLSPEGVILVQKNKAIPTRDKRCFTSLQALYEFLDTVLLKDFSGKKKKELKALRPTDDVIEEYHGQAETLLESMSEHFAPLNDYFQEAQKAGPAAKNFRNAEGGNLLFRPAGLNAFGRAFVTLAKDGCSLQHAMKALSRIDLALKAKPWSGLLWEDGARKMITRKSNQNLAARLMVYMTGLPSSLKLDQVKLINDYASALNRELEDVSLPDL